MTDRVEWIEEPISKEHDRASFDCGDSALNDYLKQHARQNHERGLAKTFAAISPLDRRILGYYSISPASVDNRRMPEMLMRGLGRYDVPGFRLGRLAVDKSMQGQGLGGQLLAVAARRAMRVAAEVGGMMLIIDAKNERVAAWYASYGSTPVTDAPLTLLLPLATLARNMQQAAKL